MSYMVCHFGKYKAGNVFGLQNIIKEKMKIILIMT